MKGSMYRDVQRLLYQAEDITRYAIEQTNRQSDLFRPNRESVHLRID